MGQYKSITLTKCIFTTYFCKDNRLVMHHQIGIELEYIFVGLGISFFLYIINNYKLFLANIII